MGEIADKWFSEAFLWFKLSTEKWKKKCLKTSKNVHNRLEKNFRSVNKHIFQLKNIYITLI